MMMRIAERRASAGNAFDGDQPLPGQSGLVETERRFSPLAHRSTLSRRLSVSKQNNNMPTTTTASTSNRRKVWNTSERRGGTME
jgi:hypothetical protein